MAIKAADLKPYKEQPKVDIGGLTIDISAPLKEGVSKVISDAVEGAADAVKKNLQQIGHKEDKLGDAIGQVSDLIKKLGSAIVNLSYMVENTNKNSSNSVLAVAKAIKDFSELHDRSMAMMADMNAKSGTSEPAEAEEEPPIISGYTITPERDKFGDVISYDVRVIREG